LKIRWLTEIMPVILIVLTLVPIFIVFVPIIRLVPKRTEEMLIVATMSPTQTEQGASLIISGRLHDENNQSISNSAVVISIEINKSRRGANHRFFFVPVTRYTDMSGLFEYAFFLGPNPPRGNFTVLAFITVDKPGYDTAHLTLNFTYATPNLSTESSVSKFAVTQGQTGSVSLTIVAVFVALAVAAGYMYTRKRRRQKVIDLVHEIEKSHQYGLRRAIIDIRPLNYDVMY
jgi:hypothetical protein